MDSPDINQNPASAIGTAFLANGGAPQGDTDLNATPAPVAQPSPQNAQPTASAQPAASADPAATTAKHTLIGKFFHNLTNTGSGSSASGLWRSIIGGALAGIAGAGAAEDAPMIQGPYGAVRDRSAAGAASRGFQAGMNLRQQKEDRQRKQAQQDQESKIQVSDSVLRQQANARAQIESIQRSAEHDVNIQRLKQEVARNDEEAADRAREKVAKSNLQQTNHFNLLNSAGAETLQTPDGKDAEFDSMADAEAAAHKNPKFYISGFLTRTSTDPATGKFVVYKVPDKEEDFAVTDDLGVTHHVRTTPENFITYRMNQQKLVNEQLTGKKLQQELADGIAERKKDSAYQTALADLDKNSGDIEKMQPSSRAVLLDRASKDYLQSTSALRNIKDIDDPELQTAVRNQALKSASLLDQLHGVKKPDAAQVDVPSGMVRVQLPGQPPGNIPADKLNAFLRSNPGAKQLSAVPTSGNANNNAPINIQLPDSSTIQSSPENVGRYLNSNKGSKIADVDAKRFQQWSADKQRQDAEDREASQVNLQD